MDNNHSEQNIRAAKAWQQMKDLLDAEMPVDKGKNNNKRKFTLLLLLLLIGGCGAYKLFNYNVVHESVLTYGGKKISANRTIKEVEINHEKGVAKQENRPPGNLPVQPEPQEQKASEVNNAGSQPSAIMLSKNKNANRDNTGHSSVSTGSELKAGRTIQKQRRIKRSTDKMGISTAEAGLQKIESKTNILEQNKIVTTENKVKNDKTLHENEDNIPSKKDVDVLTNQPSENITKLKASDSSANKQTPKNASDQTKKLLVKIAPPKPKRSFHLGLEWAIALPFGNNTVFREVNAKNQPLTVLIPALWVSKDLTNKSSLLLSVNPYSQYLLNKRSTVQSGNYSVSATSASNIGQPVNSIFLSQTFSLAKVMGIEAALQYAYRFSDKWSIAAAIGNTWTNTALFKERIVRNTTDVLKDSLYGVVKTDKDWQYINSHFVTGKINLAYQLKHYQLGATLSKPLTGVYERTNAGNQPWNVQVFLRWKIR